MMMWERTFNINGYDITFISTDQDGLVIPPDAPLGDAMYIESLQQAQSLFNSIRNTVFILQAAERGVDSINSDVEQFGLDYPGALRFVIEHPDIFNDNEIDILFNPKHEKPVTPKRSMSSDGYVYLIQSPSGHYKIGHSNDPDNRIKTFGIQLPFEVDYICTIQSPNVRDLERDLHDLFSEKRVNGEWFKLSEEDVEYIKELAE